MNKERSNEIRQKLLTWYDENKRNLPWRYSTHPYSIWISEIMAQQTRISTLLPYYERFMRRFPTVSDLANAEEDEVLKLWEGLGYYSRARNLRRSAQMIVSEWDGRLPNTEKGLRTLPGIGEYTAGAILSIAFGLPVPAVDGNVLRVFSRLENSDADIALPQTKALAKQFVSEAMSKMRTGCFTQSLMELGALVCLPKNPECETCPLQSLCRANLAGCQNELPKKTAQKPKKDLNQTILLLCTPDDRIMMRQRTEKLLRGLWTFYMIERKMDEPAVRAHLRELGYTVSELHPIGKSKHIFTHLIWHMEGFFCTVAEDHTPQEYVFWERDAIKHLAIPTALRIYAERL